MPVNEKDTGARPLYQREQYEKGGPGRLYWDYRDRVALSLLDDHDRRIIDVGCGEGITLEKLVALYPSETIIGIDIMQENVDICRDHGLSVFRGTVYDLDFADDSVDAVIFMEVIEHLEFPETAVHQICRILKPGGKLITVFPNDHFFKVVRILTFKFREAWYDPGHLKQWTPEEMMRFLKDAGFKIFFSRAIPFYLWTISLHNVTGALKIG